MQKTILKFSLFILTLLAAFFAWRSVDVAISVAGASVWATPTVWFSAFFILLALSAVLIEEFYLVSVLTLFSLFFSLFFAPSFWHAVAIFTGFLLLLLAVIRIRKDLHLNIRIDMWKTIRTGSTLIVFALGLVIASQYYFSVKNVGTEKLIPKFKMQGLSSSLTSKIIATMNPDFKNLEDQNLTVDQLILETQNKQDMLEEEKQMLKNNQKLILEQGRKQLAEMTGAKITGQEKVSDLFSEVVNNKINNYIVPNPGSDKSFPILPMVMAFILFLTVIPLGSFLSPFLILIASLLFRILVATKMVTVRKVMKEVEVLE